MKQRPHEDVSRRKLDAIPLHQDLYALAFFQSNVGAMKQQVDWAVGKPGAEAQMLSLDSDTEAWFGRLKNARMLSRQAVESARRGGEKEPAAARMLPRASSFFERPFPMSSEC